MPNKLTTEEFVRRAKEKHGDKYDYSLTIYEGSGKKVTIICTDHGEFLQVAKSHLDGSQCPPCAIITGLEKKRQVMAAEFVQKAIAKHGDLYNYAKVEYVNTTTVVIIVCPFHGEFQQTPNCHLSGCGCSLCGRERVSDHNSMFHTVQINWTTETWIAAATLKFGDKYTYDKVLYIKSDVKVTITCVRHGDFDMLPSNHLNTGQGCPKCAKEGRRDVHKMTCEEYIAKAQAVHCDKNGPKYDYSKVVYKGGEKAVIIICINHGEFEQNARSHTRGSGCPACVNAVPLTNLTFAEKSARVHDDFYSYDKVDYVNNSTKVVITCPTHGDFEQLPLSHLQGKGCMGCFSQGFSKSAVKFLEFMMVKDDVHIQHAQNGGEHVIRNSAYRADGYAAATDTVYEYHGTFHHGSPAVYAADVWNTLRKCTMGELYQKTLDREKFIRAQGYKLEVMWEDRWKSMIKAAKHIQKQWRFVIKRRQVSSRRTMFLKCNSLESFSSHI